MFTKIKERYGFVDFNMASSSLERRREVDKVYRERHRNRKRRDPRSGDSGRVALMKIEAFEWTPQKEEAARMLGECEFGGIQDEIAAQLGICAQTIINWKKYPEFLDRIDAVTLSSQYATRAGLVREAIKGMRIKEPGIREDRTTHLDYLKVSADLSGNSQESAQGSAPIAINIVLPPSAPPAVRSDDIIDIKPVEATEKKEK